jgi:uncharacterized protein (DUF1800 family)/fibronectin type 3 domain-containing protein
MNASLMNWKRTGLLLLSSLSLLAAGNGLRGDYFSNTGLAGAPAVSRTDATVNFEWWGTPAAGISNNYFSARWSGKVEAPVTGAYKLATYSNAGIRVWLGGTLVIDNWPLHWTAKNTSASINLTANQQYDLKIEFRENEGSAVAKLLWSYPGQVETVIPQARLYSDPVTPAAAPRYLSELEPAFSVNGWGRYERDRSNGESRPRDGDPLKINDVQYGRGLGVHALSDLRYQLFGKYKTFLADVGVDDEVGPGGSVIFEVWLDGTRKFTSPLLKGTDAAVPVSLDVTGVNELKLIVRDGGDGITRDHADWAGARVSTAAAANPNPNPNPNPSPQPPGIPTELTATPGNAKVSLAWNTVSDATSYVVYRGTINGTTIPYASGVAAVSFNDTSVINGITYYYRVAAVNGGLAGMPSAQVSAMPQAAPAPPPPAVPSGLAAAAGNAQVSLQWNSVSGATGYRMFRSVSSSLQGDQVWSGSGTSFLNTGLTNGTMYFYRVAATNANGSSVASAPVNAMPVAPPALPPPAVPTGLAATPGNAQVSLLWNAVSGATGYRLFRSTAQGTPGVAVVTNMPATAFVNTGLTNGTTYFYSVAALNANGGSAPSAQVSAKPTAPPVPPAPTGLAAAAGNAEVTLTWAASTGAVSYNVYRGTVSGALGDVPIMTGITALTFKNTGLVNNTTYYFRVAAVNANGVSPMSNQASAKPVLPPVPGAPTGFAASPGNAQVTLTWNALAGALSYNVYRGTTSSNQGDVPLASGLTGLTWLDTGVVNGTTYYYKLAAVNVTGVGARTAAVPASPAPPATVLTPAQMSAFKFLRQSTWGPTPALVDRVVSIGKSAFLDEQFALPATPYPQALITMPNMELVSEQFFQNALQGPDQLRQRVAWALSQIWVVSAVKVDNTHAMVPYIRILEEGAFGNVRTVLEQVTLSAAMGEFLDMVNNRKAFGTPPNVVNPNENFARELMQLFTIGLTGLAQDGTPNTTPTYTQTDTLELSRVLTGWTYGTTGDLRWEVPMIPNPSQHDTGAKTVLGTAFPANQTAQQDLRQALDMLFNHPNMPPFLSRQLIQKLVKSNPTPGYISRVAAAFINNGQGVRGDLRAIVRAILTDTEAEAVPNSGKFSEPALFLTTLARGLNSTVTDHPYMTDFSQDMSQRIWFAPSVFNYYSPAYRLNGVLGPELQIWSTATAMTRSNFVAALVKGGFGTNFTVDFTPYTPVAGNPGALVDTANARLMGGAMGPEMRQAILTALVPVTNNTERIRTVLYLIASSMQYQVEH